MNPQEVIDRKVNKHFHDEVDAIVKEIHNTIKETRDKYRGYSASSSGDETITRNTMTRIFEKYSSVKQYGSPETVYLSKLIKAIIIVDVEENRKKQIANKLLNQIEDFFKD
jgi:hypothetical protein